MISGNQTNEALQASCVGKVNQPAGDGGTVKAVGSSRHWPASTESRIVRVSRVFGGKDRHSKVRTVKGLRDRRVRLSVPTAIQLYDLQDRLGLNQPSKVVDWLINAAQHEIDKLPPLQFPPQDLVAHLPSSMAPPFSNGADHAAQAAAGTTAGASMLVDSDKAHCHSGLKGFMSLNDSLGLVNGAIPSLAHGSYYTAECWSNGNVHEMSHGASPQVVAHGHSPFPSLLSLAPGSQLVFYSSEGGLAMKEAADQFPVDNLDHSQGQLSLSSARSFLHSGSQG